MTAENREDGMAEAQAFETDDPKIGRHYACPMVRGPDAAGTHSVVVGLGVRTSVVEEVRIGLQRIAGQLHYRAVRHLVSAQNRGDPNHSLRADNANFNAGSFIR